MAYLDPASNPGSKPQRFGVTNCKSSTSDKLQTFRTIFAPAFLVKFRTKTIYMRLKEAFCFEVESHAREIT